MVLGLNVGAHHQIVVHRNLAGQTDVGAFLGKFFVFNVVSGVNLSGYDFDPAGSAQSPAPAVEDFADMARTSGTTATELRHSGRKERHRDLSISSRMERTARHRRRRRCT